MDKSNVICLGDDSKAQELNEKRTILAAFCKLIAFNVFHMKLAAPIFAQLIRVRRHYYTFSKSKFCCSLIHF